MGTLTALLFATPLFGFTVTAPEGATTPAPRIEIAAPAAVHEARETVASSKELGKEGGEATPAPAPASTSVEGREPVVAPPPPPPPPEPTPVTTTAAMDEAPAAEDADEETALEALTTQGERRVQLRRTHRAMGIVTWLAMTATLTLGAIQFADEYGSGEYDQTRCALGNPILGEANCSTPYAHIFGIAATAASYATTFGLSIALARAGGSEGAGSSGLARRLRMHRALRWVHLAGMASQLVTGIVAANIGSAEDEFDARRGLGIYHLVIGSITWVALTWAGATMIGG
jgi:hypothetical protein